MNYEIIALSLADLSPDFLSHFVRRQVVENVWRNIGGAWQIVPEPFIDDWGAEERRTIVADLKRCLKEGGVVFAAVREGNPLAFAALSGSFLGQGKEYVDLLELHTDTRYRRMGLGRALFARCADWARERGAQKLYISAHSAAESQAFYRGLGCIDALWQSQEHVAKEPFDCQLEFLL